MRNHRQFLLLPLCGKGSVLDSFLTVFLSIYLFSLAGWIMGNHYEVRVVHWKSSFQFLRHCISHVSSGFPKWKSCWNECFDLSPRIVGMSSYAFTTTAEYCTSSLIWVLSETISTLNCIIFIHYKFYPKKLNLGMHVKHDLITFNYLCFQRTYLITILSMMVNE